MHMAVRRRQHGVKMPGISYDMTIWFLGGVVVPVSVGCKLTHLHWALFLVLRSVMQLGMFQCVVLVTVGGLGWTSRMSQS